MSRYRVAEFVMLLYFYDIMLLTGGKEYTTGADSLPVRVQVGNDRQDWLRPESILAIDNLEEENT